MVCGVGIGTELAIAGVVAHAFCHIIYKALLWMSAGAVLFRTGKSKCTELGGLYKTMPLTMILGTIGALAISGVPLTSGFISKTLIVAAAENKDYIWAWLVLEIASAGVFLHAGIKFPYFVFFNVDRGLRPKEAPKPMLIAMGLLAFLCVFLGCYPAPLYNILPYSNAVKSTTSRQSTSMISRKWWRCFSFWRSPPWPSLCSYRGSSARRPSPSTSTGFTAKRQALLRGNGSVAQRPEQSR